MYLEKAADEVVFLDEAGNVFARLPITAEFTVVIWTTWQNMNSMSETRANDYIWGVLNGLTWHQLNLAKPSVEEVASNDVSLPPRPSAAAARPDGSTADSPVRG